MNTSQHIRNFNFNFFSSSSSFNLSELIEWQPIIVYDFNKHFRWPEIDFGNYAVMHICEKCEFKSGKKQQQPKPNSEEQKKQQANWIFIPIKILNFSTSQ